MFLTMVLVILDVKLAEILNPNLSFSTISSTRLGTKKIKILLSNKYQSNRMQEKSRSQKTIFELM